MKTSFFNRRLQAKTAMVLALLGVTLFGNLIVSTPRAATTAYSYTTAVSATGGTVVAWGENYAGQLNVPVGFNNVTAIAAGHAHSLALKSDGTVVGWGGEIYSELPLLTPPAGLSGVTAIATGNLVSLALKRPTISQQITQVIAQVQNLVTTSALSPGQGAGLITKLNAALATLTGGQTGAACNQLNAFINQVNGLVSAGALTQAQGQALIDGANNIKANLGC